MRRSCDTLNANSYGLNCDTPQSHNNKAPETKLTALIQLLARRAAEEDLRQHEQNQSHSEQSG